MKRALIDLLKKSLEQHRATDEGTPVLKSVIEDEEIQQILREMMESFGADALDDYESDSAEAPERLQHLIDRLRCRQDEILRDVDDTSADL